MISVCRGSLKQLEKGRTAKEQREVGGRQWEYAVMVEKFGEARSQGGGAGSGGKPGEYGLQLEWAAQWSEDGDEES